jgi:hypothetical protein
LPHPDGEAIGVERQQIKWFVYAAAASVIDTNLAYLIPGVDRHTTLVRAGGVCTQLATIPAIFISIGIVILRYRLYEIDLIINRTLVYGMLTAMLLSVYFGGVAATQGIFRTITGHEQQPQLAVVVSTLVIAALFNPLRRRIQGFIDRRSYRRKYDARKTLEAFSAKLRRDGPGRSER